MTKTLKTLLMLPLFLSAHSNAQTSSENWFTCLIEPDSVVDVGFPVWGVVNNMEVERGDFVEKGQTLAELQSGVEEATVRINKARLEFAERKSDRANELSENRFTSAFDVDQASTEKELALLELERSEETLNLRKITSPISGVVANRMVSAGEYVQEEAVLQLASLDPLRVEVVLPVSYFGRINIDDTATVIPENPIAGQYTAIVTIVDKLIDAASGTMGITLELDNPNNALPAGLKCEISFD